MGECRGLLLTATAGIIAFAAATPSPAAGKGMTVQELFAILKVDSHAHIMSLDGRDEEAFFRALRERRIAWFMPCTGGTDESRLGAQIELAARLNESYPGLFHWATSFSLENWGDPDWADATVAGLERDFARGALGVKVWKDVGMVLRDPGGAFVMIDDSRFDPVFRRVTEQDRTLVLHIGEPRSCWLPLDRMTSPNDRKYYEEHPEYHAFLHPQIPNYWELIAARDRVLERFPKLRVIGCHLGSLEFDVDEVAARLERFENFAVDLAARVYYLQMQDREKVREFLIRYQDRVLYGTDLIVGGSDGHPADVAESITALDATYAADYRYFAGVERMTDWRVPEPFRGLNLPAGVLKKIFHDNAVKWFPGMGKFPDEE